MLKKLDVFVWNQLIERVLQTALVQQENIQFILVTKKQLHIKKNVMILVLMMVLKVIGMLLMV